MQSIAQFHHLEVLCSPAGAIPSGPTLRQIHGKHGVLSGCESPTSPRGPSRVPAEAVESKSLDLINRARTDNSEAALALETLLVAVARQHSAAMRDRDFVGHVDPDGRTAADRLRDSGIPVQLFAENVAFVGRVPDPASHIHTLLMANPGHRNNILDSRWQVAGVGVATSPEGYWITQLFGSL